MTSHREIRLKIKFVPAEERVGRAADAKGEEDTAARAIKKAINVNEKIIEVPASEERDCWNDSPGLFVAVIYRYHF